MFVDFLTKIVCDNFPNLWKLGQSYVNGKLMKEVTTTTMMMFLILDAMSLSI